MLREMWPISIVIISMKEESSVYIYLFYHFREQETISCAKFVQNMDSAVKHLMETAADQTKKHQGPYKREFQKIGQAFYALGQAMGTELPKGMFHFN